MAPIEATIALSHTDGVSDSTRARELYKYFQPNAPVNSDTCFPVSASEAPLVPPSGDGEAHRDIPVQSDITSSKISSPDTALTAFCQLLTWRTGAHRAMIGLIDAETQYFVAESTKTVDLVDTAKHAPGDDIWMGCSSVSKAGKLCEKTIAVAPKKPEEGYPVFIVNDLTKDERFNQLPFVTGGPLLKFYAGVPLITKRGIAIGSLFIVDDQVRDGLSKDDIHFMGMMARTVMKHMEMVREVEEHRRGMKMSRGLASFVEGRSELEEADIDMDAEGDQGTKVAGRFETEGSIKSKSKSSHRDSLASGVESGGSVERKEREYSAALAKAEEVIRDSHKDNSPGPRPELTSGSQETSYTSLGTTTGTVLSPPPNTSSPESVGSEASAQKVLCSRAANLIRETFEVDGGCVFYDAQGGFDPNRSTNQGSQPLPHDDSPLDSQPTSSDELGAESYTNLGGDKSPQFLLTTSPGRQGTTFSRALANSRNIVDILGFSTPSASSIHDDENPGNQSFKVLDEKSLQTLLRRYPRGKLWTFGSDGELSSSSDDDLFNPRTRDSTQLNNESVRRNARNAKRTSDAKFLSRHFSGVRQLLFVPLWDAGRSRWLSGCFVWSTEITRILSKQSELSFLTAFGNSVMAEWSRIDTEIANQKKGDFIGSISHELRSPLHGILASAEFLNDEVKSTFEMSMVETISSCGRTLLDTINHVLDYSKINHFERTWRKTKNRVHRTPSGSSMALKSDLPMINLYADIDVSVVCEEVVEGVFAGHIFQNGTAANFDMVQDARKPMRDSSTLESLIGTNTLQQPEVAVIFDVDIENYQFTTQPGAFRRVVMNLLGNALKYTSHGYVRIKLSSSPMEDSRDTETGENVVRSMVTLTVTDTGKGISPEFLRSKLFTPFAQENSLSSGTGLGLAIVRSIVNILEGDITIDSEVGRGTQVRVTLPLLRGMPATADSVSTGTSRSLSSISYEPEDSISKVRACVQGQRVSLDGFDIESQDPVLQKMNRLLKAAVTNFLVNWYGLNVVPLGQKASIIVSNEGTSAGISKLIRQGIANHRIRPSVVVLCSHYSRFNRMPPQTDAKWNVGYVAKPIGPLKLGKAIAQCFNASNQVTPGPTDVTIQDSNDLSNTFEELSLNPRIGEMLDNSRMAADSDNARRAIESPTPNTLLEKAAEFPFPSASESSSILSTMNRSGDADISQPPITLEESPASVAVTEGITSTSKHTSTEEKLHTHIAEKKRPAFLLVDDNAINLTLLSTSISKRNHEVIDKAMDGLAAVNKFQERQQGYDIIFMDISMPLLDGFGATKEIRMIEEHRKKKAQEDLSLEAFKPALVIALTGLASSEDQARAASVGVDLFLTKPVSFKDVKKMLDNWEANQEKPGGLQGGGSRELREE